MVNQRHKDNVPREAIDFLDRAGITISGSFLEIGAGLGYTSCAIYDQFHPDKVVVSDFDPKQVEGARAWAQQKYGNIPAELEFRQESALGLSFEDGSFDYVLATYVFHHVETHFWQFVNAPKAAREVQRVLKPGGMFIFWDIARVEKIDALFVQAGYEIVYSTHRKRVYRKQ
jgi:ubiquinone/menaquinone biosynthesis C-methylase UbiE